MAARGARAAAEAANHWLPGRGLGISLKLLQAFAQRGRCRRFLRLHPMARLSARPGIGNAVADDRTAVGGRLTLCERCIHTASVAARTLQTDWPFERLRKGAAEQRDAKGTGYNQTAHQSLLWSFPTSLRCVCRWTKAARSCAGNRPRQVLRHLCRNRPFRDGYHSGQSNGPVMCCSP